MTRPKVLVTCRQMQVELPVHQARLEAAGYEVLSPDFAGQAMTEQELIDAFPGVIGIIAGDDPLTSRVLNSAGDLKVLIRWGIGMDSVDHDAAAACNIVVRNTPGVFGDEVADSAMTYVLMLARGHHLIDHEVRSGGWPKVEGTTLTGARLGVIGFGSIGRAVAQRGHGFGMDVVAYDPFAAADDATPLVDLDELLRTSRFVVITAPLTDQTERMMNAQTLALMPTDAFLVNVGRGPLVDEPALVAHLQAGRIAGAGLDVFEVEPLPADSPLRTMPHVILGAHNGSNTREGVARASAKAVDILLDELAAADAS